ncbi:hemoglobin [Sphingomonas sp. PP-CE-1A-559]|uniref:group I truncated hemoglobin n=1 Tax=Sphingomonas sp. PP-CE-1A-559 TaxID=2135657 RepID=UPI0010547424|nr:group 1 truncated hemoglobin [Sphingomonas sp. PP-CE-1A-559]TCP89779.1 hemoglobin [Sphingomonas sp. PP-CE-1A-559]
MLVLALLALLQTAPTPPGEDPVAPYAMSDANAGGRPFKGVAMLEAFHGVAGIDRIVDDLVTTSQADARIGDIFKGQDMIRLRRTLKEQFCALLNGGCRYSGRDMATAHKNLGIQAKDMNALVENLQAAMRREGVPFPAQNAFLGKLAVMKPDVVTR